MKPTSRHCSRLFPAIFIAFTALAIVPASATSDFWDGSTDATWATSTNWLTDPVGVPGTGDTATFSNGGNGNTTVNLGAGVTIKTILFDTSSVAAYTIGSGAVGSQTLNFDNTGAITINSGVTANQVFNANLQLNSAAAANSTFTNNGSGLLTIAGTVNANVASGNGVLNVDGTGNTTISGAVTKTGAGNNALFKKGSGTLTLSNGSVWSGTGAVQTAFSGPFTVQQGVLLLAGGTHTATGEAVIGGVVTHGGAGQNAKIQVDAGTLAISGYLSVGRGNGTGTATSDLVLNNGAIVTAGSMSAGYNANNTGNTPKGTITLNNTSSLTVGSGGAFNLAESAGSNMIMTLNDSASVTVTGSASGNAAAQATARHIGNQGTGVLTMNGTSSFSGGTSILNVGYQAGNGTINLNSGTFTLGGELRVGATNVNSSAAGSGTVNVAGGSMTLGALTLGRANDITGKMSGTMNVSGGTATSNGSAIIGFQGDGTAGGTLNVTGGTFTGAATGGIVIVGTAGSGRGVVNVNGGTFTSVNDMTMAENASSSGSFNLTTGTVNFGTTAEKWLRINNGSSGNGSITINGGTFNLNTNSDIRFGAAAGATGNNSITINGGIMQGQTGNANGMASLTSVIDMNQNATGAANNTFNLNGGTLLIGQVLTTQANNAGGTRTFNFNGGTLKAAGNTTAFFNLGSGTGSARANVRNAGAVINSNGFNVTISQPLLHSNIGGDSATDGGLAKQGSGTLTLSGANTYTGATVINGGTLALGASGSIDNSSGVSLGTNGSFDVSAKGGYTVNQLTGSGTVLGALTVSTELAIGNSPGTVDFGNSLTLGSSSTYLYELVGGGSSADLGLVAGDLTIQAGAILNLVQLGTYTLGDKFTLFSYSGTRSGTFAGLADDSTFTAGGGDWIINYDDTAAGFNGGSHANFVTVTAVPEPAAALLGGVGILALLRRRR